MPWNDIDDNWRSFSDFWYNEPTIQRRGYTSTGESLGSTHTVYPPIYQQLARSAGHAAVNALATKGVSDLYGLATWPVRNPFDYVRNYFAPNRWPLRMNENKGSSAGVPVHGSNSTRGQQILHAARSRSFIRRRLFQGPRFKGYRRYRRYRRYTPRYRRRRYYYRY